MFLPKHEITFENDSFFKYSKWYGDTDTNSFYYYSEGTFIRTDKTSYILNSNKFNPDSLELICSIKDDPKVKGLRLKISTEMFNDIFEFHHCRYIVDLDSQKYEFFSSFVDTILPTMNPKQLSITLTLPPDSVIPSCNYSNFKTLPVKCPDNNFTFINVWFPDVSKYFNWYNIENVLLKSTGRGKKRTYKIGDDNWPVILIEK